MKWLILLLLTSCAYETGEVQVFTCPDCENAYSGFEKCVFYDLDPTYKPDFFLIDEQNYFGEGIPVKVKGYMHHKFCFNSSHSVTGSANPTVNGLTKNDNIVVLFESKRMSKNFETEMNYLLKKSSGRHLKTWYFNGEKITQLFCPRDGCEKRILEELNKAKTSIIFLTFSFTSDEIADLLIKKYEDGLQVEGIIEKRMANGLGSEYRNLKSAKIQVKKAETPGTFHHKAFIIDNKTVIFGSYNPSKNANLRNAETVIITSEKTIIDAYLDALSGV